MPIYAIALRVQEDATAEWRHQATLHAIRANANSCWDEAMPLVLIESSQQSSREVAMSVLDGGSLSSTKDVMVVIDLRSGDRFVLGHLTEAATLDALLRRFGGDRDRAEAMSGQPASVDPNSRRTARSNRLAAPDRTPVSDRYSDLGSERDRPSRRTGIRTDQSR